MNAKDDKHRLDDVFARLIDTSMVVALICAPFLLMFTFIRSYQLNEYFLFYVNVPAFVVVSVVAIFRKKFRTKTKSIFLVTLFLGLAYVDLFSIGYMSMGYTWLIAASILTALYFGYRQSLFVIGVSLLMLFSVYILKIAGFRFQVYDFNYYAERDIVLVIRGGVFLAVALIVVFSYRHINTRFQENIEILGKQKVNLLNSAIQMRKEIDFRKRSEKTALDSEHKFRNLFESSSDPMVIVGQDRMIRDYNAAFFNMVEEEFSDLKGVDFMLLIPKSYSAFFEEIKDDIRNIPSRFDLVYKSEISNRRMFIEGTTTMIDFDGELAVLGIFRDNTSKQNRERLMYSAALEAEERERLRMSKELHDGLGPLLSTLKIYYEALEKHPENDEIRKRIKLILNDSITSVKEISNNLSPYVLQNLGVVKALRAFIDKIVFAGKIEVDLVSNIEDRFDEKIEITVYRLITELINNTLKHAKADKITISLIKDGSIVRIEYADNGKGFDLEKQSNKTAGIGLFNMKSRIENIGGVCQFYSAIDRGFTLNAKIDIDHAIV